MKAKYILPIILCVGTLSSCSTHVGHYTIISTQEIDLKKGTSYYVDEAKNIVGTSEATLVGFNPIQDPSNTVTFRGAINDAIMQGGEKCVGLANANIDVEWWGIGWMFGHYKTQVSANPVMKK